MSEQKTSFDLEAGREALVKSMRTEVVVLPITEHPYFNRPQWDWGVVEEHWVYDDEDPDTGWPLDPYFVPEDRSGWVPEWDGCAMADFWDGENFRAGGPPELVGVRAFLKPEHVVTFCDDE